MEIERPTWEEMRKCLLDIVRSSADENQQWIIGNIIMLIHNHEARFLRDNLSEITKNDVEVE